VLVSLATANQIAKPAGGLVAERRGGGKSGDSSKAAYGALIVEREGATGVKNNNRSMVDRSTISNTLEPLA
jgi:hypothetical protein